MKLIFASQNLKKANEISQMLGNRFEINTLTQLGYHTPLEETGETFHDNALQKAQFVFSKFHLDCFADDSGLEVNSLNGAPGIYSARYSGAAATDESNVSKLISEMKDQTDRSARFVCVIALIMQGEAHFFEGEVKGVISTKPMGNFGFGYDPVFIPEGYAQTMAELPPNEKNKLSHRGKAVMKMAEFLFSK